MSPREKIVLVEDDPTIRTLVRDRLAESGWEVSAHETGEPALVSLTRSAILSRPEMHWP